MRYTILSGNIGGDPNIVRAGEWSCFKFSIANNDETRKTESGDYEKLPLGSTWNIGQKKRDIGGQSSLKVPQSPPNVNQNKTLGKMPRVKIGQKSSLRF